MSAKVVKKYILKTLAKECGRACGLAMSLESQGQTEASTAMRAHAERLGNVLEAMSTDKKPEAREEQLTPIDEVVKPTWGNGAYEPQQVETKDPING